jgi:subtilisin-like proprotein convertase family protein
MKKIFCILALSAAIAAPGVSAAPVLETHDFPGLGLAVPDGNPSGLANAQSISSVITNITTVTVDLNISGTWNGDLYAYLTHGSGIAVLLNRSGKTAADAMGYGDDGFAVTLDDTSPNNIHTYQGVTIPSAASPLTGTWQPDGRNIDPDLVVDTDPSTALLSSFNGEEANGGWTLFVADLSGGEAHVLES